MAAASDDGLVLVPLRGVLRGGHPLATVPEPVATPHVFVADADQDWTRFLLDVELLEPSFYPLVLFGPTGVGKTAVAEHLVAELALRSQRAVVGTTEGVRPAVLSAVDFARLARSHADTDSLADFRRQLLSAPAVLLDDGHHLERSPFAQTECLHLLDEMARRRQPLVVAASHSPTDWPGISAALRSRLNAGLAIPIGKPGPAARRWILARSFQREGIKLRPSALEQLASRCAWTYPRLNQIARETALTRQPSKGRRRATTSFTLADTCRWTETTADQLQKKLPMIAAAVGREFETTTKALRGPSRRQSLALGRAVAVYLTRRLLECGYAEIGRYYGGRDHSTIIHACEKIERLLAADTQLEQRLSRLIADLETRFSVLDSVSAPRPAVNAVVGTSCS